MIRYRPAVAAHSRTPLAERLRLTHSTRPSSSVPLRHPAAGRASFRGVKNSFKHEYSQSPIRALAVLVVDPPHRPTLRTYEEARRVCVRLAVGLQPDTIPHEAVFDAEVRWTVGRAAVCRVLVPIEATLPAINFTAPGVVLFAVFAVSAQSAAGDGARRGASGEQSALAASQTVRTPLRSVPGAGTAKCWLRAQRALTHVPECSWGGSRRPLLAAAHSLVPTIATSEVRRVFAVEASHSLAAARRRRVAVLPA